MDICVAYYDTRVASSRIPLYGVNEERIVWSLKKGSLRILLERTFCSVRFQVALEGEEGRLICGPIEGVIS